VTLEIGGVIVERGHGEGAFRLEVPSFVLRRGECLAVTGPSGCGKSTLLDVLGLIRAPDQAKVIEFRDPHGKRSDVSAIWRRRGADDLAGLRARHIGYVLQSGGLLPFLNVRENIHLSLRVLGVSDRTLVAELVEKLGIGKLQGKMPAQLSIGERQRVAIARALAHRPALLLADEPTAALDPFQGAEVIDLLIGLVTKLQSSAVIVSHDWNMIRAKGLPEISPEIGRQGNGSTSRFSH